MKFMRKKFAKIFASGHSFDKLSLKLQKLREEKEEAVTSAFRVGPHSGTTTA